MREAVIVSSSRTVLAKSVRGSFNLTRPDNLAAHCIQDVLRKLPQLDPGEVEDVIFGCGNPHGAQGHNIGRVSALLAGLPTSASGITLNPILLFGSAVDRALGVSDRERLRRRRHRSG